MSPGRTDPETTRRIIVQLQHPDWQLGSPAGTKGRWHAVNGTTGLVAGSLTALLDQLDWFTLPDHAGDEADREAMTNGPVPRSMAE